MLMAALAIIACGEDSVSDGSEVRGEHSEQTVNRSEGSGEHGGSSGRSEAAESSEAGEDRGEEDSTQYALGDTFDQLRAGSRLFVSYDASDNAFIGTVENVSEAELTKVRVEIHLSNGVELGPTPSIDLAPGEVADVRLEATTQPFDTWSAHAEVGGGIDGEHGSEGSGEHGGSREGSGEHGIEGESESSREHGRSG